MYPEFSGRSADDQKGKPTKSGGGGGKVDLVCTAVRDTLTKMGENFYFLSIITSYVKMSQPDLQTVLSMIQKLKGGLLGGNSLCTDVVALPGTQKHRARLQHQAHP